MSARAKRKRDREREGKKKKGSWHCIMPIKKSVIILNARTLSFEVDFCAYICAAK